MLGALRDIVIKIIVAIDKETAKRAKKEMQDTLKEGTNPAKAKANLGEVEAGFSSLTKTVNKLGAALVAAFVGGAIYKFFRDSVQMFAEFDAKLQSAIAIMGKVDGGTRNAMGERAKRIAVELNMEASAVAEAYKFMASAGLDAQQSMAALPAVAAFAKAGQFDLAKATNMLVDSTASLGYRSKDAKENLAGMLRVADALTKAEAMANATTEQFAEALQNKSGPALRMFGKNIEEGIGALSVMAQQGIKGSLAGERLAIFMRQATTAAIKHKEAFKAYGITVFDTNGHMRNLADIVEDMTKGLGGLSAEQQTAALSQLGFQVRTQDVVKSLIGQAGAMRDYERQAREATGFTKDVADKQLQTFAERWGQLQKRVINARMEIGQALIPALEAFADTMGNEGDPLSVVGALKNLAQWMSENKEGISLFGRILMWLVRTPIMLLAHALDGIASLIVTLSEVIFGTLCVAFNILAAVAYMAMKSVGGLLDLIGLDGAAAKVNGLADAFNNLNDKIAKLGVNSLWNSNEQAKNFFTDIGKMFSSDIVGSIGKAPNTHRLVDDMYKGLPKVKDNIDEGNGTDTPDDDTKKGRSANRNKQNLLDELQRRLAATTQTYVDDAFQQIDKLERRFHEAYGEVLPKEIEDGLKKLRAAAKQDAGAAAAKDMLDDLFGHIDDLAEGDIIALQGFIDQMKEEQKQTTENSKAWEAYNEIIERAIHLQNKYAKEEDKERKKREKEAEKEKKKAEEDRLKKWRELGVRAARDMQEAFRRAFDDLISGSRKAQNAFNELGRGIGAAMMNGFTDFFMKHAEMNFMMASEQLAFATADAVTPGMQGFVAGHLAAAAKFAAIGSAWAAAGGAAAAGSAAISMGGGSRMSRGSRDSGGSTAANAQRGGDIYITIDGVDKNNPRHQRLIGETMREYQERYGGEIKVR